MNESLPYRASTDAELDELLGVYALDAIENSDERAAVEAYVARSPRARAELDVHRQVAAALGNAVVSAPPDLWARISGQLGPQGHVANTAPPLDLSATVPIDSTKPRSPFFRSEGRLNRRRPAVAPVGPKSMGGLRLAGTGRSAAARPWIGAASVAACFAVAASGLALHRSSQLQSATSKNRQLRSSMAVEQARSARLGQKLQQLRQTSPLTLRLAELEGDSSVRKVMLVSSTGSTLGHVLLASSGEGYVIGDMLPQLPAGHTYQLWGVKDGSILSLGVMGRSPKAMPFTGDEKWSQLVLTDEASPGVTVSKAAAAAVALLDQA